MQLAKKAANHLEIEMFGLERVTPPGEFTGEGNQLGEIAFIRGHRVGRRVAIQADVVEKLAELIH